MYLGNDKAYAYYRGSEQHSSRGNFLILAQPKHDRCEVCNKDLDVRAEVRDYYCDYGSDGKLHKYCMCGALAKDSLHYPIRAFVRKVALAQMGHWMMGRVNIGGKWFTVSGAYGHDGLTMGLPWETYIRGKVLPDELYQLWANGGGHNSAGNEAGAMRKWAIETLSPPKRRAA